MLQIGSPHVLFYSLLGFMELLTMDFLSLQLFLKVNFGQAKLFG